MENSEIARGGNERTDNILRGIISIFESTFPGCVRGYCVMGSYADKSEVESSDIDLVNEAGRRR